MNPYSDYDEHEEESLFYREDEGSDFYVIPNIPDTRKSSRNPKKLQEEVDYIAGLPLDTRKDEIRTILEQQNRIIRTVQNWADESRPELMAELLKLEHNLHGEDSSVLDWVEFLVGIASVSQKVLEREMVTTRELARRDPGAYVMLFHLRRGLTGKLNIDIFSQNILKDVYERTFFSNEKKPDHLEWFDFIENQIPGEGLHLPRVSHSYSAYVDSVSTLGEFSQSSK